MSEASEEPRIAIRARGLVRRFGSLVAVDHLGLEVPRDAEALRSKIGYMTQRFSLYDDLSVEENLLFLARIYSLPRRLRRQRIHSQLEDFRLVDQRRQRAGILSGGERQRLALAAATLHEPELLFLDEPTSAVDPQSRRDFWEQLFDMVDGGTTILVSTHFMDEAERCHSLAILDHGAVVASGPPRTLMREIQATIIEIETKRSREARLCLEQLEEVRSVAQLGTRLHAIVDPSLGTPELVLRTTLEKVGIPATVTIVQANLEDVFVEATRRTDEHSGAADSGAALPGEALAGGTSL